MKKKYTIILFTVLILSPAIFKFSHRDNSMSDSDYENYFQNKYGVYSVTLPTELSFAGEQVPLDYFDVRESLDQELLVNIYWQSQTLLFIKRANKLGIPRQFLGNL